jgi:predicted aspartyl protease
MRFPLVWHQGLIAVSCELQGPAGVFVVRLALDTGSMRTLVNSGPLVTVGHDPATSTVVIQVGTASGIAAATEVTVDQLSALGQTRLQFPVLALNLPFGSGVDGLLGLDFFPGTALTIDFRAGFIDVT